MKLALCIGMIVGIAIGAALRRYAVGVLIGISAGTLICF